MRQIILGFLLLLMSSVSGEENLVSKVIPAKGSNDFGKFEYHTYYRESDGRTTKIESYLTKPFSEKCGFYLQITYFKNGKESAYEMFENEDVRKRTGITKRIDHVDEDDNVVAISLEYEDNANYEIQGQEIKTFDKYQRSKFRNYLRSFEEGDKDGYIFEAPLFRGITNVSNTKKLRAITKEETYVLKGWQKMHGLDDHSDIYENCIEFDDGQDKIWIAVQKDMLNEYMDFGKMLIYYYYLGGYKEKPVFVAIGFFESK